MKKPAMTKVLVNRGGGTENEEHENDG